MVYDHLTHFISVAFHIETSRLICRAKQETGFCMKRSTGLNGLRPISIGNAASHRGSFRTLSNIYDGAFVRR